MGTAISLSSLVGKDSSVGEVRAQALEDDDVWGDNQGRLCVVFAALSDGVEILPGYCQGHHFGLAAAGGHLHAVAGELVVLKQTQLFGDRREAFQQVRRTRATS